MESVYFEQTYAKLELKGGAEHMLNYPLLFFVFSLFVLWLSAQIGASLRRRWALKDDEREDFNVMQTATLTLLALIIGFSFSIADNVHARPPSYR